MRIIVPQVVKVKPAHAATPEPTFSPGGKARSLAVGVLYELLAAGWKVNFRPIGLIDPHIGVIYQPNEKRVRHFICDYVRRWVASDRAVGGDGLAGVGPNGLPGEYPLGVCPEVVTDVASALHAELRHIAAVTL